MAVTTSANVTATIYAKIIEALIILYQYDEVTAVNNFRYKSLIDLPSATASFPRYTKNAVASVATETTTLVPTTLDLTSTTDITVGRVGIAREITNTAIEDSILGRALFVNELVVDAARLYGEQLDTDGTALFSGITAVAGSSGVALTVATLVAAFASQRTNKVRGQQVCHLHDLQVKQLHQSQSSSTSTTWASFYTPNADSSQYAGMFMGAPILSSSKNPTANAAADRVGAVFAQGQMAPQYGGLALVVKRNPSSLEQSDILQDANIWASFMRYGVGNVANNFMTKIISANS